MPMLFSLTVHGIFITWEMTWLVLSHYLDEVVDIDRPGSANSQRSNVDLFSTEVAEKADEKVFDIWAQPLHFSL